MALWPKDKFATFIWEKLWECYLREVLLELLLLGRGILLWGVIHISTVFTKKEKEAKRKKPLLLFYGTTIIIFGILLVIANSKRYFLE